MQKRRSLLQLCIAIRTFSFVNSSHEFDTKSLPPSLVELDLGDSPIRSADVPALTEVFLQLGMSACSFSAWRGVNMEDIEGAATHKRAWNRVFDRVTGKCSGRTLVEDDEGPSEDGESSEEGNDSSVGNDEGPAVDDESG